MPFSKALDYKRFNVGEYMRTKRLNWTASVEKNKKLERTATKLRRLDKKVRIISIQFVVCIV